MAEKEDLQLEIRLLQAKQQSFYKHIQTLYDLSQNLKDDVTIKNFLIRLKCLDNLRSDYVSVTDQLNISNLKANPKSLINFDTLTSFDELFCHIKSVESDILDKLARNKTHNLDLLKKLPALELRGFDGNPTHWSAFYENFKTLIHNNENLCNAEKIQYLLGKLSGKALLVCSGIQPVASNYELIWNSLIEKYEDKRTLGSMYLEQILNFKGNHTLTQTSLELFIEQFCSAQAALSLLGISDLTDFIFLHIGLNKLDKETVMLFEQTHRSEKIPSFASLVEFVKEQNKIFTLRNSSPQTSKQNWKVNAKQINRTPHARSLHVDYNKPSTSDHNRQTQRCPDCEQDHHLFRCNKFNERDPKSKIQFVRSNKLCINCLSGFHVLENCRSKIRCFCGAAHHSKLHSGIEPVKHSHAQVSTLLCKNVAPPQPAHAQPLTECDSTRRDVGSTESPALARNVPTNFSRPPAAAGSDASLHSLKIQTKDTTVLLPTAVVYVYNNAGERFKMRVLLDTGSSCHIVTKSLCNRLNLKINKSNTTLHALGDNQVNAQGHAFLTFESRLQNRCKYSIKACVMDAISRNIPNDIIDLNNLHHIKGLPLADEEFYSPGDIDCLIGNELFPFLLENNKVAHPDSSVAAIQTTLGYILMGKASYLTPSHSKEKSFHIFSENTESNLDKLTQRFWELDSVPTKIHVSQDDSACERIFSDNISRDISSGRYIVSLPFKYDTKLLGDSFAIAKRCLLRLEKQFNNNPSLRSDYNATLKSYIDEGYLNKVSQSSRNINSYYIPHRAVCRPDKQTSKTRIVLNASCKTTSGKSLNDLLYTGPNLQSNIFDLLLNLRLYSVALSADVEKMYFRIKLKPEDHRYQRILYRFDSNDPIDTYEFNCVSFGLSASPYLAMRVIKELANDERSRYPAGAWAAGRHFYMDDFVSSVPSLEDATNLYYELVNLFNAGGFKLTKWISNNTRLLQEIPPELRSPNIVQFDEHSITASTKIVGLQWEPNDDVFTFKVNVPTEYKCTKRIILSVTARLFDPLSLLGPVTALLKLLVQECWKQNLHWDEEVSTSISDQWFQLQRELHLLERLQIPRHIGIFQTTNNISLIGFADASEKCYGAVIYLRVSSSESGDGQITLLCSRSRVASPKGNVSLPRLELCANLLLSNLIVAVKDSISERVTINKIYAFSDSTIALSWVRSPAHRFQTFVANRIAAINANLPAENWFHISGKENPADIISRPILPAKFINNTLWFHGPPWATLPFKEWPINECHSHAIDELPEHKTLISLTAKVCTDNESTDLYYNSAMRMSNWNKFIHSWVYVLRFTKTLKSQGNITVADLEIAENYILRAIQKRHCLNINSPALRKLNAFLDSNKIIRVGGRLSQSQLGYSQMHPVVLPSKDRIVHLLVDYFHRQNTHAGPALLLALLRQNYWVIAARNMVRQRVQSCNRCFKLKPKNTFPVMGDLPPYRVSEVKSFVFSGVDFAGPLYITPYRRRGVKSIKAYLCLFVCLTTKALHLELVSDLSTESFLNAFKRFISRKGPISLIRSDSGGAFVKADRCLKEIHELLSKDKFLDQHLADLRIQLQRNPPYAPHFGGIWESNIKSVKTHLFRVIGNQILTYEELNTVLIQIEGIMNSRPLCVLSSDPSDLTALTPSHFLNITPLKYLPAEDLTDVPQNRLTRYQLLSKLVQSYWDRWNREYLTSLQSRQKWNTPSNPIKVGCIVIIRDDNSPPLSWPLAIVEELYPGRDGIVRAARVKTRIGYYTRAVVRLCPLPLQ
ncbi:uncharacterized protein LOC112046303 [Bicyclus anynana]|uniref:Uncharacterized protein LOC112046303 n=1 Tax=Bicyclus anynana TaxID=110368 RepID=A0ABM3LED2_BICAN|nr:uncharacterized protein LOC112046303 [Bicyclus anynana]